MPLPSSPAPTMLREQQAALLAALDAADPAHPPLCVAGGDEAAARVAVYRATTRIVLREALAAVYPVVKSIVGAAFFVGMADAYRRAHPSTSGDVSTAGAAFPDFLAHFLPTAHLDYLPDVARLEWARHCALSAADASVFDASRLATVAATAQENIRFQLAPSLALLASAFPLDEIWRVNQPDYAGDMALDWASAEKFFVVVRPHWEVEVARVSAGTYAWLRACAQGSNLVEALAAGVAAEAGFDLARCLVDVVAAGMVVSFTLDYNT